MEKEFNLCEILKGLEGIEFYSTLWGYVEFYGFNINVDGITNIEYPLLFKIESSGGLIKLMKDGKFDTFGECIVFPSKDQRDWSKFQRPIKEGTYVMCRNKPTLSWILGTYLKKENGRHYIQWNPTSQNKKIEDFNYIIEFSKFNPNDTKESLKFNIQR